MFRNSARMWAAFVRHKIVVASTVLAVVVVGALAFVAPIKASVHAAIHKASAHLSPRPAKRERTAVAAKNAKADSRHERPPVVPVLIARLRDGEGTAASSELAEPAPGSTDVDPDASHEPWKPARDDTFRTVCVRLCDGAYVPVSFATTSDRLADDAARCESSCGSPARLYISRPDAPPELMRNLAGAPYTDLPTASKFRTTYEAGCTCRGQGPFVVAASPPKRPITQPHAETASTAARASASTHGAPLVVSSIESTGLVAGSPAGEKIPSALAGRALVFDPEGGRPASGPTTMNAARIPRLSSLTGVTELADRPTTLGPVRLGAREQRLALASLTAVEPPQPRPLRPAERAAAKRELKKLAAPSAANAVAVVPVFPFGPLFAAISPKTAAVAPTKPGRREAGKTVASSNKAKPQAGRGRAAEPFDHQRRFSASEYWRLSVWVPND